MGSGSLAAVGRLFGTDGVRGAAGTELTRDLAYGLGRAAVVALGRHGASRPTFLVGRDTRRSGVWLEQALTDGIRSAGGDVILAGVEPTPAIAFLTTEMRASSASIAPNPRPVSGPAHAPTPLAGCRRPRVACAA